MYLILLAGCARCLTGAENYGKATGCTLQATYRRAAGRAELASAGNLWQPWAPTAHMPENEPVSGVRLPAYIHSEQFGSIHT